MSVRPLGADDAGLYETLLGILMDDDLKRRDWTLRGLCSKCGGAREDTLHQTCLRCRTKSRQYARQNRAHPRPHAIRQVTAPPLTELLAQFRARPFELTTDFFHLTLRPMLESHSTVANIDT